MAKFSIWHVLMQMNVWKDIPPGDEPPILLNMAIEVVSNDEDSD
jgi:hypothetical protein